MTRHFYKPSNFYQKIKQSKNPPKFTKRNPKTPSCLPYTKFHPIFFENPQNHKKIENFETSNEQNKKPPMFTRLKPKTPTIHIERKLKPPNCPKLQKFEENKLRTPKVDKNKN
jgi:hypothetical protein